MSVLSNPPLIAAVKSTKEFTFELTLWWAGSVKLCITGCFSLIIAILQLIERIKKSIMALLAPRDSILGRPFSPISLGGLTASVALGGVLFGHNGIIKPVNSANQDPSVLGITAYNTTSPITSDVMVDSSKVKTIIPADRIRDKIIAHQVQAGETVESIAQKFNISADTVRYANNLSPTDTLTQGHWIDILPVSGVLYTVKSGDTIQTIASHWNVPAQAIVDINWLDEPYQVNVGQRLVLPNAVIPTPTPTPQKIAPQSNLALQDTGGGVQGTGQFLFPTSGEITQGYSYYHNGIDIGAMGAAPPIHAADSGTVIFAGWWAGGGGNSVWIDHHNGYITMYAHMSQILASVGQNVARGQTIGIMGETGRAFGIHLHFMVERNHQVINPLSVL